MCLTISNGHNCLCFKDWNYQLSDFRIIVNMCTMRNISTDVVNINVRFTKSMYNQFYPYLFSAVLHKYLDDVFSRLYDLRLHLGNVVSFHAFTI